MTNTSTHEATTRPQQPGTMTAVVQNGYGPPERVLKAAQVERPVVGNGDVLVRIRATSVNTPDLIAVTGVPRILRLKTGLRRPGTAIRGSDLAGVVVEVGPGVSDMRPGDEVFGSIWDNQPVQQAGTFAQYTVAPATQLTKMPAGVSFEAAAAAVMSGITALVAMRDVGHVGPGTRVLINGASGGVGTMAVQIARSLGAAHVIDYTKDDYTQTDQSYDVILDNVLNRPPAATARLLTPAGVFIPNSIGTSGGLVGALPAVARASLLGRRGRVRVAIVTCTLNRDNLTALSSLLTAGEVHVVIDRTYPLADAAQAMAHMLSHRARGKVAITV